MYPLYVAHIYLFLNFYGNGIMLYFILLTFVTLFLRFPSMFMYVTVFHLFSPLCSIPLYDYHNLLICFSVHGDLDYFQYLAIMNAVVNILLTTM